MTSPQLQTWLHSQLHLYSHKEQVFNNVCGLLSAYPSSLRPKTQVYTYSDGTSRLLLSIYGTIPCWFRNHQYSIPIELYLPPDFPLSPPMVYVIAQVGMGIRPGNHVDPNGRCYHPYLSYWADPAQGSSLVELCGILSGVFSKDPPLYSKQQQQQQQSTNNTNTNTNTTGTPPPLPPKPISRPASGPPPPLPPVPQLPPVSQPTPKHKPIIPDILDQVNTDNNNNESSSLSPESSEKSHLLDEIALELGKRASQAESTAQSAFHQSQQIKDNLQRIQLALTRDNQELSAIQDKCIENKSILTDRTERARQVTIQAQHEKPPDIDSILSADNAVFNQLYQLVAQDRATDDTIYILSKALDNESLSLDVFIKHTRNLARDQFLKRALVLKIAQDVGL